MSGLKVAVLGLGLMGSGMAGQLLAKGFDVAIYNRDRSKSEPYAKDGGRVCATPAEAAADAQFVIAMLANDEASKAVWLGEGGALCAMAKDAVAIESSTLSVGWVRELAQAAANAGIGFIDAPVTGSKVQAQSGELKFIVGGETEVIDRARPVLEALGTDIARLGPVGSGALLKLINNFMCGVQVATLAEALAMAERSGLDANQTAAILAGGAPGSPLVKMVSQRMLARDYTPNFLAPLMAKDLSYAIEAFKDAGIELKTASGARERFLTAAQNGFAESDISSIIEPLLGSTGTSSD